MLYTDLTQMALDICFEAHSGQRDKGGMPYVFHPFHLAEKMETEEEVCAALLHDVAEDTKLTLEVLAAKGFPPAVMQALTLLTHNDGTPYLEYVRRLKDNPLAARVKLADLRHNSTAGRLKTIGNKEIERMKKYLRAQAILTGGEADLEKMTLKLTCRIPYLEKESHKGKPEAERVKDQAGETKEGREKDRAEETEKGREKDRAGESETEGKKGQEKSALLTAFLKPDGKVMKYILSLPDEEEEKTYISNEDLFETIQKEQLSVAKTYSFISSI